MGVWTILIFGGSAEGARRMSGGATPQKETLRPELRTGDEQPWLLQNDVESTGVLLGEDSPLEEHDPDPVMELVEMDADMGRTMVGTELPDALNADSIGDNSRCLFASPPSLGVPTSDFGLAIHLSPSFNLNKVSPLSNDFNESVCFLMFAAPEVLLRNLAAAAAPLPLGLIGFALRIV